MAQSNDVIVDRVDAADGTGCVRLRNGDVDVVVTVDVGPRVIHYSLAGGENVLRGWMDDAIETELGTWRPRGGHRLWTAPEARPRSYVPDDAPVDCRIEPGGSVHLISQAEAPTGIQKEVSLTLDRSGSSLKLEHRIFNRGLWPIAVAPWAITVMAPGGIAVLPQEPYRTWEECVLPARPMVLWHYTDLTDPRWSIGSRYIRLRPDPELSTPQKIGILNTEGWAAYERGRTLFVKWAPYVPFATYPDFGCNTEVYTASDVVEVETLGPLSHLKPNEHATHVERWALCGNIDLGARDEALSQAVGLALDQLRRARAT